MTFFLDKFFTNGPSIYPWTNKGHIFPFKAGVLLRLAVTDLYSFTNTNVLSNTYHAENCWYTCIWCHFLKYR